MLRHQRDQPGYSEPGPGAGHQMLQDDIGAEQAQQHGQQGQESGPSGFGKTEQQHREDNPQHSRIAQLGVYLKQGIEYAAAQKLLYPEQSRPIGGQQCVFSRRNSTDRRAGGKG